MESNLRRRVNEMLGMLREGKMTEAQQLYFADNVITQEGGDAPVVGKQAAVERLSKFRETLGITEFLGYKIGRVAIEGDTSFYDAVLSVKLRSGESINLEQVVKTVWSNGAIVHERYFHS